MNPLISLCMIAKNEEKVLDRCLRSVCNYVDEIIIVDTGSTDRTKEIAGKYTQRIYDFVWINDFAAARNEAIKHAKGTWIFVLDADEYMEEEDIRGLREFLAKEKPTKDKAFSFIVRNFAGDEKNPYVNEGSILRAFGNRMDIWYARPIHEQPHSRNNIPLNMVSVPFKILHTGYLNSVMSEKDKHNRNMSIFNDIKSKKKLSAYDHCMLGMQLATGSEFDDALKHFHEALRSNLKSEEWYKHALFAMLDIYLKQENYILAWTFLESKLKEYSHYPDIQYVRGTVLRALGFYERAKNEWIAAHKNAEQLSALPQDITAVNPMLGMYAPLWQLAVTYESEFKYQQSVHYLTMILMTNDQDLNAIIKLVEILTLQESVSDMIRFLDKLLNIGHDTNKLNLMAKIGIAVGNRGLAQHYVQLSDFMQHASMIDQLRYAILLQDEDKFDRILKNNSNKDRNTSAVQKLITAGVIAWKRADWLAIIEQSPASDIQEHVMFARSVLNGIVPEERSKAFDTAVLDVLSTLYALKQWDVFDNLIEPYGSAYVIDKLANYFLTKHYKREAMQYYQHLLDSGVLSAESCDNLAFIQSIEGDIQDALDFWNHAIDLNPNMSRYYVCYITHCKDSNQIAEMKQRLISKFPVYAELHLLNEYQ